MKRRDFLSMTTAASAALWLPRAFGAQGASPSDATAATTLARGGYGNVLILVELKGGNDGLNTVILTPTRLTQLRPGIGIKREQVIQLDERTGLASRHAAIDAALERPATGDRAGRQLPAAESLAFPIDRDMGHRLALGSISA
jgi:uncharacterized protein (DUF1501 family)